MHALTKNMTNYLLVQEDVGLFVIIQLHPQSPGDLVDTLGEAINAITNNKDGRYGQWLTVFIYSTIWHEKIL